MKEEEHKNTVQGRSTLVIVAIICAAVGFLGGMKYRDAKAPQGTRFDGNIMQRQGQNGRTIVRGSGFRPVNGEVVGRDDKSITVKMSDGSTKIILISSTTTINKAMRGDLSDVLSGNMVAVFGSENSDGSITAQNVQINPESMGFQTKSNAEQSAQ